VAFIERLNELAHHDLWSLQDILCTATHLIAEGIEHAVEKCRTADDRPGTRGVVCGGGSENGFIVQQIRSRICETSWCVPGDLELEDVAPRSTQAALLALLHVDHVPANLPHLTGAQTPRVLGRLTPGAPFNWHRLLELMAQNKPSMMSLRRAI
jgi:1,6-anhydro-N-acetylmuramate kinase